MTDRPILFSAPMVRALLDGRKTQTRRVLKPTKSQRERGEDFSVPVDGELIDDVDTGLWWQFFHPKGGPWTAVPIRFNIRDRLWVKETWQVGMSDKGPCVALRANSDRVYPKLTGPDEGVGPSFDYDKHPAKAWRHGYWIPDVEASGPWGSPLHMPRWASRLTLIVEGVKVERLKEINEVDAKAEGLERQFAGGLLPCYRGSSDLDWRMYPDDAYAALWNSLHGPDAWSVNPWVVAVTFRAIQQNIDRIAA